MTPLNHFQRRPRWFFIPIRVLLVTLIITLLSFAVSLLLGIGAVLLAAKFRGVHPDMRIAYRLVALPAASVVGAVVLISSTFLEMRHYQRAKTLNRIEQQITKQMGHAR